MPSMHSSSSKKQPKKQSKQVLLSRATKDLNQDISQNQMINMQIKQRSFRRPITARTSRKTAFVGQPEFDLAHEQSSSGANQHYMKSIPSSNRDSIENLRKHQTLRAPLTGRLNSIDSSNSRASLEQLNHLHLANTQRADLRNNRYSINSYKVQLDPVTGAST